MNYPGRGSMVAASIVSVVGLAWSVSGQTYTWSGLGANNLWGTAANWQGGAAPASAPGTAVILSGTAQTTDVLNLGGLALNSLTFAAGAGPFTVNQSSSDFFNFFPTLAGAGPHIDQFSATAQTINLPNTGLQTNGDLTFGGTGSGALTVIGQIFAIGGTGHVILNGPYAVTLTASVANTQAGTTVNAGTLRVNSDIALGNGPLTFGGGTLQLINNLSLGRSIVVNAGGGAIDANGFAANLSNAAATVTGAGRLTLTNSSGTGSATINGQLQQTGGLTVAGASNTVTLGGTNTYAGGTAVSGGATLSIDSDARLGSTAGGVTLDGGTLRLTDPVGYNTNRAVTLGPGGGTIDISSAAQPVSFNGAISGGGGLTKTGTGHIGLLTANSYTGPTTVAGGFLDLAHNQAAQNSTVTLSGGTLGFISVSAPVLGGLAGTGNLPLTGSLNSLTVGGNNASTTYSGNLSGSVPGGLTKAGAGTWMLGGTNAHSGPFTVQAGTVVAGSAGALSPNAPISVSSGATLDMNGFNYMVSGANPLALAGSGTLRLNGAALTVASGGAASIGGIVPMQLGTITAAAGATVVYNGASLTNGFLAGPGAQSVSGATAFNNVTTFNGTQLTQSAGSTLNLINSALGGSLTSNGTLNWTNGSVTPSGTLAMNGTATVSGFTSSGAITVAGGATAGTLNVTDAPLVLGGGSTSLVGTAAGSGGTINLGGQTLELRGGLLVNNGTINGTVNVHFNGLAAGMGSFGPVNVLDNGRFAPGATANPAVFSPAAVDVAGQASFSPAASLAVQIGGKSAGTTFDQVNVAGPVALAGALDISTANNFVPAGLDAFKVLTFTSRSGAFSSYSGTDAGHGLAYAPIYSGTDLTLIATVPGDDSLDGKVGFNDLLTLAQNYGRDVSRATDSWWTLGDFNYDGVVDFKDLLILAQHYGQSVSSTPGQFSPAAEAALVPEPAVGVLIPCSMLLARRRGARS